jgi:dipeptidyl-peptidase-4
MKRRSIIMAALAISQILNAQTGVVSRHEANPSGKDFTMEEVTIGQNVRPSGIAARWLDNGSYLHNNGSEWLEVDAETGVSKKFEGKKLPKGIPDGSANITKSPSGEVYAYTNGKSLYILGNGTITVAQSENSNITYGQTVSRNEFGISGGIFWSPKGSKLAFYRKDESKVTNFPLLDIKTRTGELREIKYPMNGMESEEISLGIYDLASRKTVWCKVSDFGYDRYLTNIAWSPDEKYVFIQVLDRTQSHMRLNMYKAADGSFVRTILTEDNDRWIEPLDPIWFIKGTYSFIYRTDNRDGYRNLYLCDTLGNVRRLTAVDADVQYLGNDGKNVWYTSAEVSPVENHLFRIGVKLGKDSKAVTGAKFSDPERLTKAEGWHRIAFNDDFTEYIDTYSSFNVPGVSELHRSNGKLVREIGRAKDPIKDYRTGEVLLGTVKSSDGKYDNWYRMFLPANFDASKKYPVVLYVYGGPHSQMVTDSWLGSVRMWEMLMAQKGYIVYVQDNRGTQNRGAEFEKAINDQCGQCEMADQMVGINMLKSLPFVDSNRIGVHGWSYGGFMTISLMTNFPETFKVGVAGGPVIDWKWYEVMYGERYMDTEALNPEGFKKTSLINKAADLKGRLLICQGAIDNTVVWEHSLSFVQECIEKNVQLDYFPYPCSEHNVFGKWRVHLMDKVTQYFDDNL